MKNLNKGILLLVLATTLSFLAGIIVTYAELSKGFELLIFPGIPFACVGGLLYLRERQSNKIEPNTKR